MVLGIIKKEIPITETISKKSIYLINDQMFRFWYRFVFKNMSLIVSGHGEMVYENIVKPQLNDFMGIVFEDIAKQYLLDLIKNNAAPFFLGNIGKWWGNNPTLKRQEEIDIMSFRDDYALFGECKWVNALVDYQSALLINGKKQTIPLQKQLFIFICQKRIYRKMYKNS